MAEISVQLTDKQMRSLYQQAIESGLTVEEIASFAVSEGLRLAYALPSSGGTVTEIKGLIPASRGPIA